jgi:aerobic carbon-monoxide dehydrogenase medium subunit
LKPPPFEYFAPTELSEAIALLSSCENARLLAGGQSLMAMLNMRYLFPDRIVDLNRVSEVDFIHEEVDAISVGAMTRQRTLQRSPVIAARLPVIPKALRYVGHFQTRNRGTIGGSLCQLDPSAELPAIAMAYDATVVASGPGGQRDIPFDQFPLMFMTSSLAPDEILTCVHFNPWRGKVGTGFSEFSRRHGDFAIAGAIALLGGGEQGIIHRASLTLFGIAEAPKRVRDAEAVLVGRGAAPDVIDEAARLCIAHATLEDAYGSAEYRGHVAAAMAKSALNEAAAELDRK